jgi:uncharacterized membrane protein
MDVNGVYNTYSHIYISHDGSMVLPYMVCHGSHQYTPVMFAYIPAPWIRHGIGIVSQSIVVICHYNLNVGYYQHLPTIMGYYPSIINYIFWLVVWHMFFSSFFHILGIRWTTDFHIFQRGRSTTNQQCSNGKNIGIEASNHWQVRFYQRKKKKVISNFYMFYES